MAATASPPADRPMHSSWSARRPSRVMRPASSGPEAARSVPSATTCSTSTSSPTAPSAVRLGRADRRTAWTGIGLLDAGPTCLSLGPPIRAGPHRRRPGRELLRPDRLTENGASQPDQANETRCHADDEGNGYRKILQDGIHGEVV